MSRNTYRLTFITQVGNEIGSKTRMLTLSQPIEFESDLLNLRSWAATEFAVEKVEITSVIQMTGMTRPDGHIAVLGNQSL